MKFEEALNFDVHSYMPTKKETLIKKALGKKKRKDESIVSTGATGSSDVQGLPNGIEYVDEYGKRKKIVRRKFPKTITI